MRASRGVSAGLMDSGGLGVALPCASAKHFRLYLQVFDVCSYFGRSIWLGFLVEPCRLRL